MAARAKAGRQPGSSGAMPPPRDPREDDGGDWYEIHRLCDKLRQTLLHLRAHAPTIYQLTMSFLDARMDTWLRDREDEPNARAVEEAKQVRRRVRKTDESEAWLRRQLEGLDGGGR